jgi:hypothetical protein
MNNAVVPSTVQYSSSTAVVCSAWSAPCSATDTGYNLGTAFVHSKWADWTLVQYCTLYSGGATSKRRYVPGGCRRQLRRLRLTTDRPVRKE